MDSYIKHGDCLSLMEELQPHSVDMVLCDLPYGITARNKWDSVIPFEELWTRYKRIVKHNGAIVLFGQGMFTADLMRSNSSMWRYNMIWQKTQPTGFLNAKKMPLRNHEDIVVFYAAPPTYNPQKSTGHPRKISKAEHKTNCKMSLDYGRYTFSGYDSTERYPLSVVTFAKDTQKESYHPTQKPVALCEYLIKTYTNEGDIVLDNCMGVGTTCVAAINTNRKYIGFELDSKYFDIAKIRIQETIHEVEKNR